MEKLTRAIDKLFAALDCMRSRRTGSDRSGDPLAVAHRLLNTLPVTRKVSGVGWSDETRTAHRIAIAEHSARMKRRFAV